MTQPSLQKDESMQLREVRKPFTLFFFPVLGFAIILLSLVLSLLAPVSILAEPVRCIGLFVFIFSVVFFLVLPGALRDYLRLNRSSSSTEAKILREYYVEDDGDLGGTTRSGPYWVLKFTITSPSGDVQEIKGHFDGRLYRSKPKGSKIKIRYATQYPYVISLESA
jgi:hypothetical protein